MTAEEREAIIQQLQLGSLDVEGLLPWSSNYTFLVHVCPNTAVSQALNLEDNNTLAEFDAVYKPRQGERPLWDFPSGTLCNRERAAYLLSNALNWHLIPPTVLRDGPHGIGSLQFFIPHDPDLHYFTFEGDPTYTEQIQKIVLFDVLINNADRKAGHVLIEDNEALDKLWAIDHGICFHAEPKLRTVIWEFAGQVVPPQFITDLVQLKDILASNTDNLRNQLEQLINRNELQALLNRLDRLIQNNTFNVPGPGRHYPWPPV